MSAIRGSAAGEAVGAAEATLIGRMARDLTAFLKLASRINSILDPEALQLEILKLIFEVVPASDGACVLVRPDSHEITSVTSWQRQTTRAEAAAIDHSFLTNCLTEKKPALAEGTPAVLCVPLISDGDPLGAIYLVIKQGPAAFQPDHLDFAAAIAAIASVAIQNAVRMRGLVDENRRLQAEVESEHHLVGESNAMRQVHDFIRRVAGRDCNLLILGESGTGKELVARAIHHLSSRSEKPFMAINCAALTETLLESELFGYEKGAFTGATARTQGKLEAADGGTVLLDEVGELSPALQAKLLRVLQDREFLRVGGVRSVKVDIRVIAATNRDLLEAIRAGGFRADLFYRLNVVAITLPPLRERRDDIPLLADHFASVYALKCNRRVQGFSPQARDVLQNYNWPGNIRELQNAVERAVVLGSTETILAEDLPETLLEGRGLAQTGSSYYDHIDRVKRELILRALESAEGKVTQAARSLGVHPNYLHRLMRQLGIRNKDRQIA